MARIISNILEGVGVLVACWLGMIYVIKGIVLWAVRRER
jgi:hypothetical protein